MNNIRLNFNTKALAWISVLLFSAMVADCAPDALPDEENKIKRVVERFFQAVRERDETVIPELIWGDVGESFRRARNSGALSAFFEKYQHSSLTIVSLKIQEEEADVRIELAREQGTEILMVTLLWEDGYWYVIHIAIQESDN